MSLIVTITGSSTAPSRTAQLTEHVGAQLAGQGFEVAAINVRDLPPEDLIYARAGSPALQAALELVAQARGVVVSTPIYKAAYSGVLKTFLDLLPQFGLGAKVVLPLATGGTTAHVLALDYALRPVLLSLGAQHVVAGLFVLDKLIPRAADGRLAIDPEMAVRLDGVIADFVASLRRAEAAATVW
jgi:FMN reductase